MPGRALNDALKSLAVEAATRFSSLVASGEQIPFDVAESAGPESHFHEYLPLTSQFVRDREEELRSLPAFGPACDAVAVADVATAYLEARGEAVPVRPRERAAAMLTHLIASLWEGCTEFALDRARLDSAIAALGAEAREAHEADLLIAPIVGLRMSMARLQLPHGVLVARADTVEAPIEAMRSEGMGRAAWEPQFLVLAEQGEGREGLAEALCQLRELISVMRLFKGGGIGLGPYAFAPTGDGNWRRVAIGAPATRSGGYQLSEEEGDELASLAESLAARPDPEGSLAWAVERFEMGCERESPMAGLSDHLLSLRAVLEGHGPVGASLPMRAAALISDDSLDRIQAREKVELALELERATMNGSAGPDGRELASWVEEGLRRLLRDAALGELEGDISTVADETLISTGLDAGDPEIAVTVIDSAPAFPDPPPTLARTSDVVADQAAQGGLGAGASADGSGREAEQPSVYESLPLQEDDMDPNQETRIMEPIPDEDEIRITATHWLDEVTVEGGTLEWPAVERDIEHRERVDTPRVRHLFPVPEDADWEVGELRYDHYRHGAG